MAAFNRFRRQPIKGYDLPGPRFTRRAWFYFALYVALPVLALGLALDAVLYVLLERWFDSCYAVLCLFE